MGIFDDISSFFNPQRGYENAGKQSEKYYVDAQGRLQPIVNQGQAQYDPLNKQATALANPVDLQNQWASAYQESPQAKQLQEQARTSGLDAASSMGLLGSSPALQNIQTTSSNILQGDRQSFLNDLMQKYMQSIGIRQNIYGAGAGAASEQSQNAMNQGVNAGQAAYGATNAGGELVGHLINTAAQVAGNYAGGRKAA